MRGYFVVNMYLSDIQRGIQAAHCIHDMFVAYTNEYLPANEATDNLKRWATDHKTMIVLNGGSSQELEKFNTIVTNAAFQYKYEERPFAHRTFEEENLGYALTCVGVVLPTHYVDCIAQLREDPYGPLYHPEFPTTKPSGPETLMLQRLAKMPLA